MIEGGRKGGGKEGVRGRGRGGGGIEGGRERKNEVRRRKDE